MTLVTRAPPILDTTNRPNFTKEESKPFQYEMPSEENHD